MLIQPVVDLDPFFAVGRNLDHVVVADGKFQERLVLGMDVELVHDAIVTIGKAAIFQGCAGREMNKGLILIFRIALIRS